MLTFITGPVRAGKSALAERLARASGLPVTYCAAGAYHPEDPEWIARIERHRAQRPKDWALLESAGPGGADLIAALAAARPQQCLLIESAGTWLGERIGAHAQMLGDDSVALHARVAEDAKRFLGAIETCVALTIVVSEEAGWGVVPAYPSGRIFRDVLGRVNQRLAACAQRALLVVCGVAIDLKQALPIEKV